MNLQFLSYLGYAILALCIYLVIAPIPKLLYYKIKYGKAVEIYYFPFIGLLGQIIIDLLIRKDAFYSQKRYLIKNKNIKLHVSSDLKGGVHFSLVDPKLKKLVYFDQESYKKMEGMPFADAFMDQGLLFQNGESWNKSRKMLQKHFTYEDLITMIGTLKEQCVKLNLPDGPIDILSLLKQLTSTTITKTFFGCENERIANLGVEVNKNMEYMMKIFLNPLVVLRCFALKLNKTTTPSWLLSSTEKKFLKVLQEQKQKIIAEIENGINQKSDKVNILTTMCKEIQAGNITKDEATHQYFTLLIAGIDSTSHVLKNFCYALGLYPEVQQRLREEIKKNSTSLTDLKVGDLKLMNNFINEAYRHFTAVPSLFNRVALKDVKLGEFVVSKGQSMDLNMMMSNFDPVLYENPLEFNMDRWDSPQLDSYAFTPFSAGPRNCIGQHLAMLEIKTVLSYLLLNYELSLNSGKILLGLANLYGPTRTDFLSLKLIQNNDYESIVAKTIAQHHLGQYEEALTTIEKVLETQRFEAYYWKGLTNFVMGRIQQAQDDLKKALTLNENHIQSQQVLRKCELELKNPKLIQTNQEKKIQQQDVPQKLDRTDIFSTSGKLMYKWYQTDLKVGIEIHHQLKNNSDLKYQFEVSRLQLSFPLENGNNFELDLDLFGEIIPENSKVKIGLNIIEFLLDKKDKLLNWKTLEKPIKDSEQSQQQTEQASYPTSSQRKKDWNKIDKEIEEDINKHKEEYGEDPLNSLFKQIYQNGDENTRRAMIKSMQTSGGTVLSTNWDEVKQKDYERKDRPSPPKGQEYKKLG